MVELGRVQRITSQPITPVTRGENEPAVPLTQAHTTLSWRLIFGRLVQVREC